jgi:hypothetical protein
VVGTCTDFVVAAAVVMDVHVDPVRTRNFCHKDTSLNDNCNRYLDTVKVDKG